MSNAQVPPKIHLCQLPTPLHRLNSVSEDLGIDLWIKRDDLTGFAGGGNKGRKLEYLMPQILSSGADTVVTCGAIQSNFIRQLAGACAVHGLKCVAACMELPFIDEDHRLDPPSESGGNLIFDRYFPIERHIFPNDTWDKLNEHRDTLALSEQSKGAKVFVVKLGGGSPEGVYGFYQAGLELVQQLDQPADTIIVASSSGSTHVGLAHAFQDSSTHVIGVSCDPEPELPDDLADLSSSFVSTFGIGKALKASDFDFRLDWVGPGYGVPGEAGQDAIQYLAQKEGILLDPVYSCKAFAALLDLARSKAISGRIVFWHTGGVPALFTT